MINYPNCKINIGLNIVNKRQDGYHDLETIFYPIDNQRDRLEITRVGEGGNLYLSGTPISGNVQENLCIKAYNLLNQQFNLDGITIKLHKNIPTGAGLGGGSADAAFTLKMLNELFELNLPNETLKTLALELGSDVPFFIDNIPSFATGRGEILEPITLDLSHKIITLITPPVVVSTKMAYQNITPRPSKIDLREAIKAPIHEWKTLIFNDFEKTIFTQFPLLQKIKNDLYFQGADYVSMSGSGSAIFAIGNKNFA